MQKENLEKYLDKDKKINELEKEGVDSFKVEGVDFKLTLFDYSHINNYLYCTG